jgi:hypothetical protein
VRSRAGTRRANCRCAAPQSSPPARLQGRGSLALAAAGTTSGYIRDAVVTRSSRLECTNGGVPM